MGREDYTAGKTDPYDASEYEHLIEETDELAQEFQELASDNEAVLQNIGKLQRLEKHIEEPLNEAGKILNNYNSLRKLPEEKVERVEKLTDEARQEIKSVEAGVENIKDALRRQVEELDTIEEAEKKVESNVKELEAIERKLERRKS